MRNMINFYKYEGAGNDFIMVNNMDGQIYLPPEEIKKMCDRHFGIGADGVILVEKSDKADCFMNYINSDGSLAEMCGNGVRCTARFYKEQTNSNVQILNIETRAGIKEIKCNVDGTYSVDMGEPKFQSPDFPSENMKIEDFDFSFVSLGNPHAVTIIHNLDSLDIKTFGPKIEKNSLFPNKINVEFIEKISDDYYKVKVWERGCGETLACGTGACAVFAILAGQDLAVSKNEITLEFPGGKLFVSQNEQDLNQSEALVGRTPQVLGHIILRGPATFVFKGDI